MPAPPYARLLTSRNGGAPQAGYLVAQPGDTIQFSAESVVDFQQYIWEIYSYPPGWSAPAGWLTDSHGIIFSTALTPPSFALPALPLWGKWLPRLRINEALTNTDDNEPPLNDSTAEIDVRSPNNLRDTAAFEEGQSDPIRGYAGDISRNWRIIDAVISGAIPTGVLTAGDPDTSFVTNHAGTAVIQSLLANANISATAAIAGTKIAPNFGAQSIVTSGTANLGATTVTGLTIGTLSGFLKAASGVVSANASISLTTDVSGLLPPTSGGTGLSSAPTAGVVTSSGTAYSSVTAADGRVPFWGSSTLTSSSGLTFAAGTLSATNVTVATALTLSALAGTDGPLQVVGGVAGVGPGGASTGTFLNVADVATAEALAVTGLPDGTLLLVRSLHGLFELVTATRTDDHLSILATPTVGRHWVEF